MSKIQNIEDYQTSFWKSEHKIFMLKKAIAICNRLPPSKTKARHASRLFSSLNKERGTFRKLMAAA